MTIPPVNADNTIPVSATCQEASIFSRAYYMPCGARAVAIVYHDRDRRGYYMCAPCADHNVRNRGGRLVAQIGPINAHSTGSRATISKERRERDQPDQPT